MAKEIKFVTYKHIRPGRPGTLFHHPEHGWVVIIMEAIDGDWGTFLPVVLPKGYRMVKADETAIEN